MFNRHIQAGEHRQHIRPPGSAAAPFGVQRVADFAGELPPVEETQPLDEMDMGLEEPVGGYDYSMASRTAARIDTLRSIVQNGQHEEIDGMIVDLQTANLLIQIYEKGNDNTKNLIDTAPLEKVVGAAWKLTSGRTAVSLDAFEQEGYDAWHRDEPAAPAANKMVMDALEGASVGDRSNIEIMKAFSRGFERGRQEMMDREFPEMRGASRTADRWLLDDLADMAGMTAPLGNGWEVLHTNGGGSVLFREFNDYDSGKVSPPDSPGGPWNWSVHARLYQVNVGSGAANTAEEAMSMVEQTYAEYKRTASRKASIVAVPAESLQVGDVIETHGETVTIIGEQEPWVDPFGREMFKYMGRIESSGKEGYITFGPGGTVEKVSSRKTAAVTWYDQSDQFGGMWSTYQGSAPDSPNGQISESNGTYRWYVSDSGTRGNQQTGEVSSLEEAKREAESALASLGVTASRTASHRTAFLDTLEIPEPRHRVAGWDWSDHLNGFVAAEAAREFTCACGDNVPAPGYTDCRCGKRWNAYSVLANGERKLIAREVPVRENVVMARTARRKTAAGWNKGTHPDISDLSDEQLQDFIDNVQESIDAGANVGEIMKNKRDRFEEELRSRGRKATRKIAAPSSGADAIAQYFPGWRVDDENGNFWEIQSPGGEHAFIHEEDGTYTVLTNDNTPDEFWETGLSFEDALAEVRAEGVI